MSDDFGLLAMMMSAATLIENNDFVQAERTIEAMIKLDSNSYLPYFTKATMHATKSEWEKCEAECVKALERYSLNGDVYNHLGVALCKQGKIDNGLKALKKSVELGALGARNNYDFWSNK